MKNRGRRSRVLPILGMMAVVVAMVGGVRLAKAYYGRPGQFPFVGLLLALWLIAWIVARLLEKKAMPLTHDNTEAGL